MGPSHISIRLKATLSAVGLAAAVIAFVLSLLIIHPPLFRQIDLKLYDHYLGRLAGKLHDEPKAPVVVVDIDEATLQKHGQWPWPRYRLAQLIERLVASGAKAVALDIVLAEQDRTSPHRLLEALRRDLGIKADIEGLPDALLDNDVLLAQVVSGAPVIFGGYISFSGGDSEKLPPPISFAERSRPGAQPALHGLLQGKGMIQPVPELTEAAPVGFFNMSLDMDGIVRRVPLLIRVGDDLYPSLCLRALMTALHTSTLKLSSGPDGLEYIGIGKRAFPVMPDGSMLLPYRGPARTFPYLSAGDLLDGTQDAEQVRGKIVFIGSSATGLQDLRSTPFDRYMPGVEIHATAVDAILGGYSVSTPPWNIGLQALLITLLGALSALLFGMARPAVGLAYGAALPALLYYGAGELFFKGLFVSPLWSILSIGLEGMTFTMLRFWRAEQDKRRIRQVFSRYVSPEIVSRIVNRGDAVLRGEERELTVMFTDLRGFTSLSEKLSPEQVVRLLNRYFTPMTELVRGSHGTLDKFIGDALMAFWNAPHDVPDHPNQAAMTALAMQQSLAGLNEELERDFGGRLAMGVGLHTGPAYVGNMGSATLTNYTAIGDTVNLASRLEGLCARLGVGIAMSSDTASRLHGEGIVPLRLARMQVKGRIEPVDVHTVLSPEDALARKEEIARHTEALRLYEAAIASRSPDRLRQATEAFKTLADAFPRAPLYAGYVTNGLRLAQSPPETWTDVLSFS